MKVARFSTFAIAAALVIAGLLGSHAVARAQATADTPSGYGRTYSVIDLSGGGAVTNLSPTQRLAYLLAQSIGANHSRVTRGAGIPMYRSAGRSGERGGLQLSQSRSLARPVGR